MILLIGAKGYIGSAFAAELKARNIPFIVRSHQDWESAGNQLDLVINCAAFIPSSVSQCDNSLGQTIRGNVVLPSVIAEACAIHKIPFAHISTGCLWNDGQWHSEDDPPQRGFGGYCGFYVGTKLLAEQEVSKHPLHYIWRIRLPFDEQNHHRNYLTKLATFPEVFDIENSCSHRGDIAKACLDLWQNKARYGKYHIANKGSIKASVVVDKLMKLGIRKEPPKYVPDAGGACMLNIDKLEYFGVKIRSIDEAIDESLKNWKP